MVEQTLVFIKPDGVSRGLVGEIISRFERRGILVTELKLMQLSGEKADEHYAEHVGKGFYPELKAYVTSGPIVVMVLEGKSVVSIVRKMIGATDSAEAEPGTIRGDYALTKGQNIIHASDSPESAAREIRNFFLNKTAVLA